MLLVQGRGEMGVLPAVTAVLLHHNAMGTWTECDVVSTIHENYTLYTTIKQTEPTLSQLT